MLSSTRKIYRQTFADLGNSLLKKSWAFDFDLSEKGVNGEKDLWEMLLIQPRKGRGQRSSATSSINAGSSENVSTTQPSSRAFSKIAIAALSLEQLQELSILVEERIQIKKRFNSTPLRRIINRQTSSSAPPTTPDVDEDAESQTDTLVNTETPDTIKGSPKVRRARYNTTPLRRILARQAPSMHTEGHGQASQVLTRTNHKPESLSVRRARFNNTPLRRIVTRQVAALPVPRKEDDNVSERADSVIDPDSPVQVRRAELRTSVILNDEERIRAYEMDVWNLSPSPDTPASSSSDSPMTATVDLNDEERVRAFEEALWDKTPTPCSLKVEKDEKSTTVTVTKVTVETKKPTRIVVDSKGSPLRRIVQRQTSKDWRAAARVGVV
jgi:hypothetical protein